MATSRLNALVLSGDGLNCEIETAAACESAGFKTRILHVNQFLETDNPFTGIDLFVIPGGFSFGDELGSGKVLALKLKHSKQEQLREYLARGGAMLGICNGFQVLTHLGVFDETFGGSVSLAQNETGRFVNRWVSLKIVGDSIFTRSLQRETNIDLPIRHAEGRIVFANNGAATNGYFKGKCVLQYIGNVNGSWNGIAGIASYEGRVMGLMPHPECFWLKEQHPDFRNYQSSLGIAFFQSAYRELSIMKGVSHATDQDSAHERNGKRRSGTIGQSIYL